MKIEGYNFGEIIVNGKAYRADIIIFPDKVKPDWWRKEGHSLCIEDLEDVLKEKPEVLIIGTGAYGAMRVPDETLRVLRERGIEVKVLPTKLACEEFNKLVDKKKVVAALHLTC